MIVQLEQAKIVQKGWGHEEICYNSDKYCGKILYFNRNSFLSNHLHKSKDEVFKILFGNFKFVYIDTDNADKHEIQLKEGDIVHIPPMLPHQLFCGDKDGAIIEFSSHHDDVDSFRVEKGMSQLKETNPDKSASAIILGENNTKTKKIYFSLLT